MATHEKDGLMDCLFSRQDMKLVNIKFFRGDNKVISTDELRVQVCSIAHQREAGLTAAGPAHSKKDLVNTRKLVASM